MSSFLVLSLHCPTFTAALGTDWYKKVSFCCPVPHEGTEGDEEDLPVTQLAIRSLLYSLHTVMYMEIPICITRYQEK